MATSQTMSLEQAEALVSKLKAEATANQFSTLENTAKTFEDSLVKESYKGEPTVDSEGNQIERIPIDVLASFIGSIMGSKFNVTAGKKYVNITRE